ncbi:hypothetical protein [Aureibacter tunicatorum]|uniref:CUB domain-containing protein n=1 Tax=Aureibacter tunicatorum TaxID=866807 RepID=A0AAE4BVE8_9BACT|nr:hypothetical protein [Aureibacter tunicatorum]MDR6242020.1 hypothetical protein [Aureibacter tunicatorum]BDD07135.1 hypothetical protein AUTU_46180 [Aureibacter tunicatorum]
MKNKYYYILIILFTFGISLFSQTAKGQTSYDSYGTYEDSPGRYYYHNTYSTFTISPTYPANASDYELVITFLEFDMECKYDYVSVYEENTLIGVYDCYKPAPIVIEGGNSARIVIDTDGNNTDNLNYDGYKIKWEVRGKKAFIPHEESYNSGYLPQASAYSANIGINNSTQGKGSMAYGSGNSSNGEKSFSGGEGIVSSSYANFAIGMFNSSQTGNLQSWASTDPVFEVGIGSSSNDRKNALTVLKNGKIGIGEDMYTDSQMSGSYKLFVNGGIRTTQVYVTKMPWADYVFDKSYELKPLAEVKEFIDENGHLPNVPIASEVEKAGVDLAEVNKLLLEKIEELTLYLIQQDEELKNQKALIEELMNR